MKKKMLTAACALGMAGIILGASAATIIQKIEAELRPDFEIAVDGEVREFKNVDGDIVYPILYEGTTYLPVRAIGELMGKTVYWYEDDKKIDLKEEKTTVTDADVIITGDEDKEDVKDNVKKDKNKKDAFKDEKYSLEDAKAAALKKAGFLEKDVYDIKLEREIDDGIRYYKVEFKKGRIEYEAKFKATDLSLLEWEIDD